METTNVIQFSDGLYEGVGGAVENPIYAFHWNNWDNARTQLDVYRRFDPNCRIVRIQLPDDYFTSGQWKEARKQQLWLNPIQKAIAFA